VKDRTPCNSGVVYNQLKLQIMKTTQKMKSVNVHLTFLKEDVEKAHELLKSHQLGDWLDDNTFHLFVFDGDWEKVLDEIDKILTVYTYNECEIY
jgi:hypothetical protein